MRRWFPPRSRGWALARRAVWAHLQSFAGDAPPIASPIRYPSSQHRASAYRRCARSAAPSPVRSASPATGQSQPPKRRAIVRQIRDRDAATDRPQVRPGRPAAPTQRHCRSRQYYPKKPPAFRRSSHLCGQRAIVRAPYSRCIISDLHRSNCFSP